MGMKGGSDNYVSKLVHVDNLVPAEDTLYERRDPAADKITIRFARTKDKTNCLVKLDIS